MKIEAGKTYNCDAGRVKIFECLGKCFIGVLYPNDSSDIEDRRSRLYWHDGTCFNDEEKNQLKELPEATSTGKLNAVETSTGKLNAVEMPNLDIAEDVKRAQLKRQKDIKLETMSLDNPNWGMPFDPGHTENYQIVRVVQNDTDPIDVVSQLALRIDEAIAGGRFVPVGSPFFSQDPETGYINCIGQAIMRVKS